MAPNCNAELQGDAIRQAANPTDEALETLQQTMENHGLSGRAWSRILKVARTIADLEERDQVMTSHILEASSFRLNLEITQ